MSRCPLDGSALEPLAQDPLVGHLLGEPYLIERVVSDGVSARRYVATDERRGGKCAVKVMYGDYASVDRHRRRFAREVEVGSRLCHPNVLAVIDSGASTAGVPYLVTVHVEGEPLGTLIEQHAPLGKARIVRLMVDIVAGLAHIHERGVVHRGLGGDAILVMTYRDVETAMIADVGIAFDASDTPTEGAGRLTHAAKAVGTPSYMSPEQSNLGTLDARSDLYSLGVLLYEMLCGRSPFSGSAIALASQNLGALPPPIVERVAGLQVDAGLEAIAMRLLQKDPGARFQSATELSAALIPPTLGDCP